MEYTYLERESNEGQEADTRGVTGQISGERSHVPAIPGTSTGITFQGNIRDVIAPMILQGGITTVHVNSPLPSSPRQERIEFGVQECIPSFFGRTEFIKKMHEFVWYIQTETPASIRSKAIVICGQGGVGKTQVIRKYIQEYKKSYNHVIWINAENYYRAISSFLQLAREIQIDVIQKPEEIILQEIYDFVCRKFTLLVFDNVESFKTDDGKDGFHRLLPQAVKTGWKVPAIIVTTRKRVWKIFKFEILAVFDLSESLTFLSSLEFTDCEINRILLQDVVDICQGLPLALQQVVTFIRKKREARAALNEAPYTLKDFLTDIANKRKNFIKTRPEEEEYPDVFTLYYMTFEQIGSMKHGELALKCLDVMAILLNPDNIPTAIIRTIFSSEKDKLAQALILLHEHNVVTRCDGYYQMHRMIQAAKIESSNVKGSKWAYVKSNFHQIVDSVTKFVQNLSILSENIHDILHNLVRIQTHGSTICTGQFFIFTTLLAEKLVDVGNYSTAVQMYRTSIQFSDKLYGADQIITIALKEGLSNALRLQGTYAEAENLITDVIQMRIRLQGPEHPDTLNARNSLATVLDIQGKSEEARELYNDVIQIRDKISGPEHPDTLGTKSNLAGVLDNLGKFEEAWDICNDVIQIQNKVLGPEHPNTLITKNCLATVLKNQEKFEEARELYNEVLQMQKKMLGPEHPDTMSSKNNLATVLVSQGQFDEAGKLLSDVLQMQNKMLGPEHPDTVASKCNLAVVLNKQGQFEEARALYIDVLQIRNKILGPEHSDTLDTKNNLAVVLDNQGKYEEAWNICNDVIQIQNKVLGPEHPNTPATINFTTRFSK